MLSFIELLEAKVTPNLLRTVPAAPGERSFVDRHQIKDILASFRQKGNDELFNASNVKIFPRKKNHFGNDEIESIKAYESENILEKLANNKKKPEGKKKHIYINGKWVGTTNYDHTNKEALKNYVREHPGTVISKVKVAQESEHWIQKAIKHPGALTKAAKKEGVSNSEYEHEHEHDTGKAGKRSRLALALKKIQDRK